jgi:exodeoxyribonuclease X
MDTGPDTIWVAHNAAFDMGFLKDLDPSLGDRNRWICTYRCAMQIWPDAPGHSNQVLRYWLDVRPELPSDLYPHRALYDTLVTDEILQRMLADHTLADLVDMSHRPITLRKMPFGKHRGVAFRDLPSSYVSWILKQGSQMDADVRHTAMQMVRNPSMI